MKPQKPAKPKAVRSTKQLKGRDVLFAELASEKTPQVSTRKPRKSAGDDEDDDWEPSPRRSGSRKPVSGGRGVSIPHIADLPDLADDTDQDDEDDDDDVEDDVDDDGLEKESEEDENVGAGKGKGGRRGKGVRRRKGGKQCGKRAKVHRSHTKRAAQARPKFATYEGLREEELEFWKQALEETDVEQSFFGTRGNEGFR